MIRGEAEMVCGNDVHMSFIQNLKSGNHQVTWTRATWLYTYASNKYLSNTLQWHHITKVLPILRFYLFWLAGTKSLLTTGWLFLAYSVMISKVSQKLPNVLVLKHKKYMRFEKVEINTAAFNDVLYCLYFVLCNKYISKQINL